MGAVKEKSEGGEKSAEAVEERRIKERAKDDKNRTKFAKKYQISSELIQLQ